MKKWKKIPGFYGYEVSNYGLVRSFRYHSNGKILSPSLKNNGYLGVTLFVNGIKKYVSIHRLVCLAFIGKCPIGMQVDHINGVKSDNRLSNLRYLTRKENLRRGKHIKINESDKIKIVNEYINGGSPKKIAEKYGVVREYPRMLCISVTGKSRPIDGRCKRKL